MSSLLSSFAASAPRVIALFCPYHLFPRHVNTFRRPLNPSRQLPNLARATFLKPANIVIPQRYLLSAIPEEFRHQPHVYGASGVHFLARFFRQLLVAGASQALASN
jgi:hypothetical protein